MHELDGADAGGQYLRTALSLAAIRGEAVRIEHVRGNRETPGLRPQHFAVLECLADITGADVAGAEVGAKTVAFDPGPITGGAYEVEIETAGSVTLLFDALLPLATRLESPLSVTATGGTDVAWSPPFDYLRHLKLPLARSVGLAAALEVDRRGFYPEGGGRATLRLWPSQLEPIHLGGVREAGDLEAIRIYSTQSADLADADVAGRQVDGVLEALEDLTGGGSGSGGGDGGVGDDTGLEVREVIETTTASPSPGSAVVIGVEGAEGHGSVDGGRVVGAGSALGEPGKPAERVGGEAAQAVRRFLAHDAPVDGHLADQVLVFLALAGGRLRIPIVTDHVEASLGLLEAMGYGVRLERAAGDGVPAGDAASERRGEAATVIAGGSDTSSG